jgi:hypothetical protein
VAAARELLEETGWRPARVEHLVTFQPMVGSADSANHVYAAWDCELTDAAADINEAVEVRWVNLDEASQLVQAGEVVGAAPIVAISELKARAASPVKRLGTGEEHCPRLGAERVVVSRPTVNMPYCVVRSRSVISAGDSRRRAFHPDTVGADIINSLQIGRTRRYVAGHFEPDLVREVGRNTR